MFELFKSELGRLKIWIVVPAVIYILLNMLSIYFDEYMDSGRMIGLVHSVIFSISSLLFGFFQFQPYKKLNRWIYLINRPASMLSLCLILLTTGLVIILLQFVIPNLLITFSMGRISDGIIESRHYLQSLYVLLIAMAFYLSGVFIQLCSSKGGFLVLTLPLMGVAALIKNGPVILICGIVVIGLLIQVIGAFKTNLESTKTPFWSHSITIITFQLGLYFVLVTALAFAFQLRYMLIDGAGIDVSWNEFFKNDVYKHVENLDGNAQLILNLENADQNYKDQYQLQLNTIKTYGSFVDIKSFHTSTLLPYQQNINSLTIHNSNKEAKWLFSLDRMGYLETINTNKNTETILSDKNGDPVQFKSVPHVINNSYGTQVVSENQLYTYDHDFKHIALRFSLNPSETFISGFNYSGSTANVITTQNIYIFDSEKVKQNSKRIVPLNVIQIPGSYKNLHSLAIAELIDATLYGFVFGKLSGDGHHQAQQVVIEVNSTNSQISTLATRSLKNGFSDLYYGMNWYVSPLTHWVSEYWIKPQLTTQPLKSVTQQPELVISDSVKITMAILILMSISVYLWQVRNRKVSKIEMGVWFILILLTSITGLLSFILMTDKKNNIKHASS